MEAYIRQIESLLGMKITKYNGTREKTVQELTMEEGIVFRKIDELYEEGTISFRDARNMKMAIKAKYREFQTTEKVKQPEEKTPKSAKEAFIDELRQRREDLLESQTRETEHWLDRELRAMGYDLPKVSKEELEEPVEPVEGHRRIF